MVIYQVRNTRANPGTVVRVALRTETRIPPHRKGRGPVLSSAGFQMRAPCLLPATHPRPRLEKWNMEPFKRFSLKRARGSVCGCFI